MYTRRFLGLGALAAAFSIFSGCSNDPDEYHYTVFFPNDMESRTYFADQTRDTLHVLSYDSWTSTALGGWFSVSPESQAVLAGQGTITPMFLTATPNTTETVRTGYIQVAGYGQIAKLVRQTYWLNIAAPTGRIEANAGTGDIRCTFTTKLTAKETNLPLVFTNYTDGAKLAADATWISIPDTAFDAGRHTFTLTVTPNQSTEPRTATLTLTSAGVSTPISVTQEGKTEDE
ncbi:MAG: BACON domain-containing protein [Alloprevotella sp.]|nr:BACON domain-containing protein [Alloprevotella sp.]